MAERAYAYSIVHPSVDGNYTLLLDRLKAQIDHMHGLIRQQEEGYLTSRSATARRRALRRRLQFELLPHLVTVAADAAKDQPGLAEKFRLPAGNASHQALRNLARQMLEQGLAEQELLLKHGLAERLLDDLGAAIEAFDASLLESHQGRRDHVGARAELEAGSDELLEIVGLLDKLNRYRFAGNAELLAAWDSARNVVSGPRTVSEEKEAPPTGEVKPAA